MAIAAKGTERLRPIQKPSALTLKLTFTPSTMKVSTALLCLLLAATTFSTQVLALPDSVSIPITCCFGMVSKAIHIRKLKSYTRVTNSHCLHEAVIFITKMDKKVCADPQQKWVQNSMALLDSKSQALRP